MTLEERGLGSKKRSKRGMLSRARGLSPTEEIINYVAAG